MDFFYILSCAGVHDSKRRPPRQFSDGSNLLRTRRNLAHFEVEVGAIKSANDLGGCLDAELCEDIAANSRCGRCGQSQYRRRLQLANGVTKTRIIGTKVVAPKRNAMRFIHSKETDSGARQAGAKVLALETLGCDIEQ